MEIRVVNTDTDVKGWVNFDESVIHDEEDVGEAIAEAVGDGPWRALDVESDVSGVKTVHAADAATLTRTLELLKTVNGYPAEAVNAYLDMHHGDVECLEQFEEAYQGEWDKLEDFAYDTLEDFGTPFYTVKRDGTPFIELDKVVSFGDVVHWLQKNGFGLEFDKIAWGQYYTFEGGYVFDTTV